jgi:hypothetical protein
MDDYPGGPQTATAAEGWVGAYANQYFASAYAEGQQWLGYAVLVLLSQRPEYRTITGVFATEMTREWIEFKSKSEDKDKQGRIDKLNERLDDLRLRQVIYDAIVNDGFQGRAQIYIDTGDEDDQEELKTPIGDGGRDTQAKFGRDGLAHDFEPGSTRPGEEPDRRGGKKKRIRRLAAIEPMWCYPAQYNADDPLRVDWYRPDTWWVMGKEVHRTRLLTFCSNPVPDMLKPAYSFGGLSRTQMSKPYVDFYLRDRTSASDLLNNFSNVVLATNLDVQTMDEGSELLARVATANVLRDNQGMFLINKDTEDLTNVSAPLGGIKDLVSQAAEHICAPCRIPIVKYFGNQPSGLNADSEGVIRMFYDQIHAEQEGWIREPITTVVNMVQVELWGEVDDDIEMEFPPLWQLDEAGKSAIQKTKADQRAIDIEAGSVDPKEARLSIARDPDSQYAGLDLHEPLPKPDPMEMMGPEGEQPPGELPEGPGGGQAGPKPTRRDLTGLTNQSARFGGATTGGFAAHDLAVDAVREAHAALALAMDALSAIAEEGGDDERSFDLAEDVKWEEYLHPRSEAGKFAPKGSAARGHHELLKSHGFVEHPDSPHAIYTHPSGHSVAFSSKNMAKGISYHSAVYKDDKFLHEVSNKREHLAEALGRLALRAKTYGARIKEARERVAMFLGTRERGFHQQLSETDVRKVADVIAPAMGFESRDVGVRPSMGKKFTLDGREYDYAGVAYLDRGTIEVFSDHLSSQSVGGVLAHEVMHQKWQAVRNGYKRDRANLMEAQRRDPDLGFFRVDGTLREGVAEKYPFYAAINEHLVLSGLGNLREDDGITDYSRQWWGAEEKGSATADQAIHETLAEMASLDWEGSLDRLLWYKESKHWGPLYRAVNDLYGRVKQ